ncbi:hypothetical protein AgCh_009196 [Apium graveolens]
MATTVGRRILCRGVRCKQKLPGIFFDLAHALHLLFTQRVHPTATLAALFFRAWVAISRDSYTEAAILTNTKRTESRAIKKVKPVSFRTKALTKARPTVNKGDFLYICDIKEFSEINLYMDELEEVRAIDAHRNLPERLVFKVHLRPYWLMEFMEDKGVRRFFRLDDQLSISSNETLLEIQEKLDLSDAEELEFHRQLQNQIEENNRKLGKKSRQSRK